MMVFLAYGAHFLSYATTFVPHYNAIGFFNPDGSSLGGPGTENQTPMFLASYGKRDDTRRSITVTVLTALCYSILPSCDVSTFLHLPARLTSDEWHLRDDSTLRHCWVRSRGWHVLPACSREHHAGDYTSYWSGSMLFRGRPVGILLLRRACHQNHAAACAGPSARRSEHDCEATVAMYGKGGLRGFGIGGLWPSAVQSLDSPFAGLCSVSSDRCQVSKGLDRRIGLHNINALLKETEILLF